MNDFEKSLINLLDECARLPIQEFMVFGKDYEKFKTLLSFENCRQAFEKDIDFADAKKFAGFWGTFDGVMQSIFYSLLRKKNDFEKSLINLLDECARLPIQEFMVFGKDYEKFKTLLSFENCRQAFEKDIDFADAKKFAGFWGTFDGVMQSIFYSLLRKKGEKITLNKNLAIRRASELRNELSASGVHYTAYARLLGVKMTCKEIILSEGLSLIRLSKKERMNHLSQIERHFSDFQKNSLFFQTVEIRYSHYIQINRFIDNAFFEADNEAHVKAHNIFQNILNGLLLLKDGQIELGPRIYSGGPIGGLLFEGFELKKYTKPKCYYKIK